VISGTSTAIKDSGSTGATGSDAHHKVHRKVLTGLIPAASTAPTGPS
jgi:hypothetical protein